MHESIILIRTPRWRRRPKADRPSLWSLWSLWRQLQKQRARLRGDRTHGWGILRDLILVFWLGPTSGCWSLVHPQFFDRNRRRSDESCRIFAYWCEGVVNVHCKGLFCCYKKTSNKKPEKELWMESKLPVVSHSNLRFCRHRRKFVDSIDSIETPKMLLSKSLSFPHKKGGQLVLSSGNLSFSFGEISKATPPCWKLPQEPWWGLWSWVGSGAWRPSNLQKNVCVFFLLSQKHQLCWLNSSWPFGGHSLHDKRLP